MVAATRVGQYANILYTVLLFSRPCPAISSHEVVLEQRRRAS